MLTLTLVLRPGFICSDSDSNSKCVCAYTPSYVMCYFVSADAVTHEDWQWLLSRGDRAPSEPNLPLDHTHTTLPLNLACMCLLPLDHTLSWSFLITCASSILYHVLIDLVSSARACSHVFRRLALPPCPSHMFVPPPSLSHAAPPPSLSCARTSSF